MCWFGIASAAAHAEPGARKDVDGASLRLSIGEPNASGRVEGVLAIDLEPGWKTYWIEPGPVGLAPSLDFSGSSGLTHAEVDYPPPIRFREGETVSAGYDAPVFIPFSLKRAGDAAMRADLRLQIGLCRELCVPVAEHLVAEPSASLSVRAEIIAARRALAEPVSSDAATLRFDGSQLVAEVPAIAGARAPDLFARGGKDWQLGPAAGAPTLDGNVWTFSFRARLAKEHADAILPPVDLVLTGADRAQSFDGVPVRRSAAPPIPLSHEARP